MSQDKTMSSNDLPETKTPTWGSRPSFMDGPLLKAIQLSAALESNLNSLVAMVPADQPLSAPLRAELTGLAWSLAKVKASLHAIYIEPPTPELWTTGNKPPE